MKALILLTGLFAAAVPAQAEKAGGSADDNAEFIGSTASPAPGEFTGESLKLKTTLEALFEASKKVNAQGGERTKARAAIDNALDWDKIAQLCLGAEVWKKQEANRGKFRALLKDVISKTAYTRLDTFWNGTTPIFEKIEVSGTTALSKVRFKVKEESFLLEYYFNKRGSNWTIYDIAYEGERYSEQISTQIAAYLKESTFASLLDKLKKRSAELDKPAPAKK